MNQDTPAISNAHSRSKTATYSVELTTMQVPELVRIERENSAILKNAPCPVCSKEFREKIAIDIHLIRHHYKRRE
jgi:hypothetical protein